MTRKGQVSIRAIAVVGLVALAGCGGGSDKTATVEENVIVWTSTPAVCERKGFVLLEGKNVEIYGCVEEFSSPPRSLGCYLLIDDVVYDVSYTAKEATAGTDPPCASSPREF